MCGPMRFKMSLSKILAILEVSDIGRYDDDWLGGLLGFNIGMMVAVFQDAGIWLLLHDKLNISVSMSIAVGPRCLRCMFDISSGPVDLEFLAFLINSLTCV